MLVIFKGRGGRGVRIRLSKSSEDIFTWLWFNCKGCDWEYLVRGNFYGNLAIGPLEEGCRIAVQF